MNQQREVEIGMLTVVDQLIRGVRSVVRIQEGSGRRKPWGSCFVLSEGQRRIVVTANHVVAGPQSKFVCLSDKGGLKWPKSYIRIESADSDKCDPDIAFAEAIFAGEETPSPQETIPLMAATASGEMPANTQLVIAGHPVSHSKMIQAQSLLSGKATFFLCSHANESTYAELGLDSKRQIAMRAPTKFIGEDGNPVVAKAPNGMSGGPIFVVTGQFISGLLFFAPWIVGVLTDYYPSPHNVFVGSRIDCLLETLDRSVATKDRIYRAVGA